jgi:hypothetical protein
MFLLGVYLVVVVALFCGVWYWLSGRRNQRKAVQVLRWIEAALAGQGHVITMRWLAPSRFKVSLRLTCGVFHRAWIMVEFSPRQMPVHWAWSKLTNRQDLLTFQADLDWAPAFTLDVHNFRWFARSSRKTTAESCRWTFQQTGPFIISTRMKWQKEITSAMTSLADTSNREFQNITFSRHSPHFSVTMPLESISPTCPARTSIFDAVREVATSSSPSLL